MLAISQGSAATVALFNSKNEREKTIHAVKVALACFIPVRDIAGRCQ